MSPSDQRLRERDEIPESRTWNAESVFADRAAWWAEAEALAGEIAGLAEHEGRLEDGPVALLSWLRDSEAVQARVARLWVYAGMTSAVDARDQEATAMADRARALFGQLQATAGFAAPEILAIGSDVLAAWMDDNEDLALYRHAFDRLERQRPHVRSAEVEELLGLSAQPFATASSIHGRLANADLRFTPAIDADGAEHDVAQGTIGKLLAEPDRSLRESAYKSYADAHLDLRNTMAACLAAGLQRDVFRARARRYPSCLSAALASSYIPEEVYGHLIQTFQAHLPTWHRYWRVRRRALGLDTLSLWDVKAPLTEAPPAVPYEQAVDWISEGMAPLGEDYVATMRAGAMEQRWVDVYPNVGKRAGAFSSGAPGTHPFIMMSYVDDLFSLSTLAHELGHSMHSYYSRRDQPQAYAYYGLFAAEVASNFNQALTRHWMLENLGDPAMQLAVVEEAFANFYRYFFLMPTLARFELAVHERAEKGEPLGADVLIGLMADLFEEGFGGEMEIDRERLGITWAQFHTHLYSNFYVYQYATGISAAHALADRVLEGGPAAAADYRSFLSAGGSAYPLEVLRDAGVDMASPEPVEAAFARLGGLVDRLDALTTPASA